MFSIARIFEVMVATAFYSGLVYMFYDGTGVLPRGAVVTVQATSVSSEELTEEKQCLPHACTLHLPCMRASVSSVS